MSNKLTKEEVESIVRDAQALARSENVLDHVIAREMIAKLISNVEEMNS